MKLIKFSLFCGSIYFLLMAIAHAVRIKIPGLFIYFNVPSYAYQDRIISLFAFGSALFFFTAATTLSKTLIKSILIFGFIASATLTFINFSTDFISMSENINKIWFHMEVFILFLYSIWLLWCYNKLKKEEREWQKLK